ncbi:MAG TPA: flagellar basal body rod C-terminal domain-containing protein [Bryobacteraceae bacterium]|jgi:flagellar hook protein FlgE
MEILAVALEGLNRAEAKVDQAAVRISQAGVAPNGSSGDTVDLTKEIVNLAVAKEDFMANLKALQAGDELSQHTIDILA